MSVQYRRRMDPLKNTCHIPNRHIPDHETPDVMDADISYLPPRYILMNFYIHYIILAKRGQFCQNKKDVQKN